MNTSLTREPSRPWLWCHVCHAAREHYLGHCLTCSRLRREINKKLDKSSDES